MQLIRKVVPIRTAIYAEACTKNRIRSHSADPLADSSMRPWLLTVQRPLNPNNFSYYNLFHKMVDFCRLSHHGRFVDFSRVYFIVIFCAICSNVNFAFHEVYCSVAASLRFAGYFYTCFVRHLVFFSCERILKIG